MVNEPAKDPELLAELTKNGYSMLMYVPGRGICGISRMVFTVGLFYGLEFHSYKGRYCFETKYEAIEAIATWDGNGDPPGDWIKHKGRIEYSNPNYKKD